MAQPASIEARGSATTRFLHDPTRIARRRPGARASPRLGRGPDRRAADRRFNPRQDARRRHRHRRAADVAADADSGDDGERHARADRANDQRQRQRGRAQVPSEPAGQQALHRRLQPRHPVEPRIRHRQQRPLGRLRRRHAALQLPRQRRRRAELSAALGHGDAGRDRSRRRDVRAVLGRLSGQLGRARWSSSRRGCRRISRCTRRSAIRASRSSSTARMATFAPGRRAPRSATGAAASRGG